MHSYFILIMKTTDGLIGLYPTIVLSFIIHLFNTKIDVYLENCVSYEISNLYIEYKTTSIVEKENLYNRILELLYVTILIREMKYNLTNG